MTTTPDLSPNHEAARAIAKTALAYLRTWAHVSTWWDRLSTAERRMVEDTLTRRVEEQMP